MAVVALGCVALLGYLLGQGQPLVPSLLGAAIVFVCAFGVAAAATASIGGWLDNRRR